MAVLGNRGTGLLEMAIEAFKDQSIPNQQLAPTVPGQNAVLRAPQTVQMPAPQQVATIQTNPELNQMPTMPLGQGVRATPQMIEQRTPSMGIGQGVLRPGADVSGMEKLAEDASKVVAEIQKNPQIEQDPGFMDQVKGYFGNRENMVKLALAFNSMRLTPDTGLASALGQELKDIRATSRTQDQRNRTAAYFDSVDPEIANAIRGGLDAKDAIALHREKQKGVVVGKMIINPTTGAVIYDGSSQGSDLPDSVQKIIWGAKQLGLEPGSDKYKEYVGSQLKGKSQTITFDKDGNLVITEGIGGAGSLGKQSEGQSKALAFGTRMAVSQDTINAFETEGTSIRNALAQRVPFGGNFISTPEFKLYDQAKRDFVNALLRWESGAAIGPAEFQSADLQYFPQPGDTPDVIENKRRNRDVMIKVMQSVAGGGDDAAVKDYIKGVKVDLFGARAANWPDTGEVKVDQDTGDQYVFKGGDPNIEANWVKK